MKTSYNGKLARINLSTGEIKVEQLDMELATKFIGADLEPRCSMMRVWRQWILCRKTTS